VSSFRPAIGVQISTGVDNGLGAHDLEHILSTFPVFARKRPEFHAYLLARLAEWKEEAGETARSSFTYREQRQPVHKVAEP
jgi:hypothetical protein